LFQQIDQTFQYLQDCRLDLITVLNIGHCLIHDDQDFCDYYHSTDYHYCDLCLLFSFSVVVGLSQKSDELFELNLGASCFLKEGSPTEILSVRIGSKARGVEIGDICPTEVLNSNGANEGFGIGIEVTCAPTVVGIMLES
uniref:PDZ domain-containing protein n=1 Tax=Schistosoma curassoni TaxID=6186 RepID=A0A183JTD0_9TREM